MALTPLNPPGRKSRKALAHASEIQRLSSLGYSLEAIREALLAVGVQVSKSTVRREAVRKAPSSPPGTGGAVGLPPVRPERGDADAPPCPAPRVTGRDVAEAFVRSRIANPLLRVKEAP